MQHDALCRPNLRTTLATADKDTYLLCDVIDLARSETIEACIALVETVAQSGAYIDYVEIDSVIAAIRARSDGGES